MQGYVPLHNHTCFSADGAGTIADLMDHAAHLGFESIAITDHGTLGGAVQFWKAAKERGIKPIFGVEAYIGWESKRGHLTVLSSGERGFRNLVALNNAAHENVQRGFPIVTMDMLSQYNDGLIVLSGCSASPLYFGDEADGLSFGGALYDIFGDRLYAEVMGVIDEDNYTRPRLLAKRLGIKLVVTTDTHFAKADYADAHLVVVQCRKGYDYSSANLWLKSEMELRNTALLRRFADDHQIDEMMLNTLELARSIEAHDLGARPQIPHTDSAINIFTESRASGVAKTVEEHERLEREIAVIQELGLQDYFTVLYDIVSYCKANGIAVGPGRGSGGGSYFLYTLGVTGIDPLQHGLLFERFLSLQRKDMADFDLDIDASRRDEVIAYAKQRWGAWPIANYATYSRPSLVRDIGRVFKVPMEIVEEAAESENEETLEKLFTYCKPGAGTVAPHLGYHAARSAYEVELGAVRHKGKHAAGVVMTGDIPVPIEGGTVAWTEGSASRELSEVGLVKLDILGLITLAQLAEMRERSGVAPGDPWDADSGPVFDLFKRGDLAGVFQFAGSEGIIRLTMEVSPDTLDDLSAVNALYRPGPLDAKMPPEFVRAKHSGNVRKLHPKLDALLAETYGVIVYQEQVMALVAAITGGNLEDADDARKIISKGKVGDPKWQAKMRELEAHFKTEGYKHFDNRLVDTLWGEIVTFGRYGFNKSHSTAYSLLSYRMAWYKVHHPGAFYTALLNHDSGNAESWVYDAAMHDIMVQSPHINYSTTQWHWDPTTHIIYAPLSAINHFGENGAKAVMDNRLLHGQFVSFEDIAKRIPKKTLNARAKKLMYYAGALRGLTGDITTLIPDFKDLPVLTEGAAQRESMGFVLPTNTILDFMHKEQKNGRTVGVVKEIERRDKGKGVYVVFRLSPKGQFWTKDLIVAEKIREGDLISASVNSYGAGSDIARLRQ